MKSKKALTNMTIVLFILSLVSLILIIGYITNLIPSANNKTDNLACYNLITNIKGSVAFFGEELDETTENLRKAISKTCNSKIVKVNEEKQIKIVGDLIEECWTKFAKGEDFLGQHFKNSGIAIYCGRIQSNNKYEEFGTDLIEILKEEEYQVLFENNSNSINFNNYYLNENNLKSLNLNEDNSIGVFYFISRYGFKDEILRTAQDFWGIDLTISGLEYIFEGNFEDNPVTNAGIILKEINENADTSFEETKKISSTVDLIIPEN